MPTTSRQRRLSLSLFVCFVAAALTGCREADAIKTYETPRTGERVPAVDVEQVRAEADHMLAAIVPQGDKAWFFKLVVRGDAVDELRKPFDEFLASVELGAGGANPTWTLPAGWSEQPGEAMRAATIEIPHGERKYELAVSSLPLGGEWPAFVERNVTRWLDQLQQPALPGATLAKLTRQTPIKNGEATLIELVGVMKPMTGMMPGGGPMPAGHPPIDAGATASADPSADPSASMPAGTAPPVRPAPSAPAAAGGPLPQPAEFTYAAPADWRPGPMNSMRKAAFVTVAGDNKAETTVMPFPASGAMADPTAQAQRWAGQVGLQLSDADLQAASKEITISGTAGQLFELLGPADGAKPLGILAGMVKRDDQVWFFKMTGDRSLVESQREAFLKFLESIKFADDGK